ncbi:hypothetical protein NQZ68_012307 [Dissostichus eleginoides]|nr:hypothetical protein NQZ68_012307 [Dissostichus eleginoides]
MEYGPEEYGSVASTPDSTPPCTDGGNDESELCELQTAREWSDDEEGEDDDEGLLSSSSIWGTPRQNSSELTFSYIAIAEAEAVGASRHFRRRCASRGSRTPLIRTDTLETLLDSPDVDWDPQGFLGQEEEEEASDRREQERVETSAAARREQHRLTETIRVQSIPQSLEPETQGRDAGIQRGESPSSQIQMEQSPSLLQAAASQTPESESPVTRETISVKLLTSMQPRGPASSTPAAIGQNSQEQLAFGLLSEQGVAKNSSEGRGEPNGTSRGTEGVRGKTGAVTKMASKVMDVIYWKDTERTGMILTGIVVGLLSLFQLSVISVLSTVSLAVMCFTISVRIYYQVLYILNWGDGAHPFKSYLGMDISLSGEEADLYMQKAIVLAMSTVESLKGLLFVKNLWESIKLLVLVYLVTYLGELSNGLTLLIISVIAVFSLPLFYRQRQEQVDNVVAQIQGKIDNFKDTLCRIAHGGGPPPDSTPGGAKPKSQ